MLKKYIFTNLRRWVTNNRRTQFEVTVTGTNKRYTTSSKESHGDDRDI